MIEAGWKLWELREGDKIRLTKDGPMRVIKRVTSAAAYFTVETTKTYQVFDRKTGEDKDVTRTSTKVDYIAARSWVEMLERGPLAPRRREALPPVAPKPVEPRPELAPIVYRKSKSRKLGA